MDLLLQRFSSGPHDTLGLLYTNHTFSCFTLEDEYREVKVPGETRIPSGRYRITLRTWGKFHDRYSKKFLFHKGMLWVRDVPNFTDILIHCGNSENDTAGCILVGDSVSTNLSPIRRGSILPGQSTPAYTRFYPPIAETLLAGVGVWLTVQD